jgi:hypothetical protein
VQTSLRGPRLLQLFAGRSWHQLDRLTVAVGTQVVDE